MECGPDASTPVIAICTSEFLELHTLSHADKVAVMVIISGTAALRNLEELGR